MGREALAKATMASTLAWDDNNEMPIDKMTAIAFSARNNEVGALLLRVDALDDVAMRKVILLIVRKLNHEYRIARGFGNRIAVSVLHELLRAGCVSCGGKGEIHRDAGSVLPCHQCGGTGLQRYTDMDRASLVGGVYNKKAYSAALQFARDALTRIVTGANKRLTEE